MVWRWQWPLRYSGLFWWGERNARPGYFRFARSSGTWGRNCDVDMDQDMRYFVHKEIRPPLTRVAVDGLTIRWHANSIVVVVVVVVNHCIIIINTTTKLILNINSAYSLLISNTTHTHSNEAKQNPHDFTSTPHPPKKKQTIHKQQPHIILHTQNSPSTHTPHSSNWKKNQPARKMNSPKSPDFSCYIYTLHRTHHGRTFLGSMEQRERERDEPLQISPPSPPPPPPRMGHIFCFRLESDPIIFTRDSLPCLSHNL